MSQNAHKLTFYEEAAPLDIRDVGASDETFFSTRAIFLVLLAEKVKTMNLIPMIEGNILLAKANAHHAKNGSTSHYQWLLST